ncbi:amidohydrolase family protein [Galbitalea sp. SE-J8]|uniref:amidohydrolase family protein n=1 Tax=Galbitalea sp. SE-J8 TaxID=3054952 RepID=UPI00259CDE5C|nr:amidohydrolase family protein [Galbitalea sp. SE-J8]MDM4762126.1 amidohydrolase family protein [Galbitalea sp. SE-J8]
MSALPLRVSRLTGARLADGRLVDVELDGDRVSAVSPAGGAGDTADAADAGATLDLDGFVLLPAPAEPHAHLDKALSWDLIEPPMGDLERAIESWVAYTATMTEESIAERAEAQVLAMVQRGTTAIRSHVDLLRTGDPLRGVRALVGVRERLAGIVDLELVALASSEASDAVVEGALDLGVDLVGGAPHLAPEPLADLRRLVAIAERRDVGADLHTDESLHGPLTIVEFARLVRGWSRNASAGHCVRLGTLPLDELAEVVAEVAASDLGVISLPITNLYLQGWDDPVATPRGLTALRALLDAGVRVGAGADNVRDPFNPVGRSDALETASLLITAGHLTLTEAYDAVSVGARDVMRLPDARIAPGSAAEFLAVRATGLADAVASGPVGRLVIHRGRLVSRTVATTETAVPARRSAPLSLPPSVPLEQAS